jgi:hypothetical protein
LRSDVWREVDIIKADASIQNHMPLHTVEQERRALAILADRRQSKDGSANEYSERILTFRRTFMLNTSALARDTGSARQRASRIWSSVSKVIATVYLFVLKAVCHPRFHVEQSGKIA